MYGGEGAVVINDSSTVPAGASVNPSGNSLYTWTSISSDPRALQRAASGRIAAVWYAEAHFDIEVSMADANARQFALYCLDWDSGGLRGQRVDVYDPGDQPTVGHSGGNCLFQWPVPGVEDHRARSVSYYPNRRIQCRGQRSVLVGRGSLIRDTISSTSQSLLASRFPLIEPSITTMKTLGAILSLIFLCSPCFATTVFFTYTLNLSTGEIQWTSDSFDLGTHPTSTLNWTYVISPGADINGDVVLSVVGAPRVVWVGDAVGEFDLSPLTINATSLSYYMPLNDSFPVGPGFEQPSLQTATSVVYFGDIPAAAHFYASAAPSTILGTDVLLVVPEPSATRMLVAALLGLCAVRLVQRRRGSNPNPH